MFLKIYRNRNQQNILFMNKLRPAIPVVLLMLCMTSVNGQTGFGIRGGINVSSYIGETIGGSNGIYAYHAGVYAKFPKKEHDYWQAALFYSVKGNRYNNDYIDVVQRLYYIDLPVTYHYCNDLGIGLLGGPQLSVLLKPTNEIVSGSDNVDVLKIFENDAFRPYDLALAGGFMFDLENVFNIEGRICMGILNFVDRKKLDGLDIRGRILNIQLSVGIHIFALKKHIE